MPAANAIRLHLNKSKTKYIGVNSSIKATSGEVLEKVDDFVYLGTERDFEVRKGKA